MEPAKTRSMSGKCKVAGCLLVFSLLGAGCSSPEGLLQRGNMAYRQGDSQSAADFYSRASEYPSTRAAASYNLGRLRFEQGRYDEARELFDRAMPLELENPMIRVYRARADWEAGRLDVAEKDLKLAVRFHPELDEAHFYLARLLGQKGDLDGALESMERVRKVSGLEQQATLSMVEWYRKKGEPGKAADVLEDVLAEQGYRYRNYLLLGQVQMEAGNLNGAESSLRKGLQSNPGEPEGLFTLAAVFEAQSRPELALQLYQALQEKGGDGWTERANERLKVLSGENGQH